MSYRGNIDDHSDNGLEEIIPLSRDDEAVTISTREEVIPLATKDYVIISDLPEKPTTNRGVSYAPVLNLGKRPVREPSEPYLGKLVLGRYEIQSLIGVGGMGRVYKAYQHTVDRFVAVKILPCGPAGIDEQIAKRFHLEARAASRLAHPNTITVHDFGQLDDGALCIVMEYLTGKTLEYVIAERPSLARVLRIALQICGSLAEAHKSGIVHRDLKPPNIIVSAIGDDKDWVKVVDFGIVKMLDTSNSLSLSVAGMVSGTPEYMSPEQVQDEPVDARSDIYSLGLLLYELFTGKPVVQCKTPLACMYAHIHNTPPPFARVRPDHGVPPELEQVVRRMLAKNPEERFQSVTELMPVLTEFLLGDVTRRKSQPPLGTGSLGSMLPQQSITGAGRTSGGASSPTSELEMLENLVELYESRGEPEQAAETYRKIALVHMDRGAHEEAAKSLKTAIALCPNDEKSKQLIETCFAILDKKRTDRYGKRALRSSLPAPPAQPRTPAPGKRTSSPKVALSGEQILAAKLERAVKGRNAQQALSLIRTTLAAEPTNATAIEYAGRIYETVGVDVLDQDEIIWLKALLGKAGESPSRKPTASLSDGQEEDVGLVRIEGGTIDSAFGGRFTVASFEMQMHPVTNAAYGRYIRETGELAPAHWLGNEPPANGSEAPVVGVSIADARKYAAWCGLRLPTAVEWEAAVRLPDGRALPWGDAFSPERCHCKENGATEPGPVGRYASGASHFGCLDLLGNVWEWTEHHEGMTGPEPGYYWVMGGSFRHPCVKDGRIARTDVSENGAYPYLGFRCVRSLEGEQK